MDVVKEYMYQQGVNVMKTRLLLIYMTCIEFEYTIPRNVSHDVMNVHNIN